MRDQSNFEGCNYIKMVLKTVKESAQVDAKNSDEVDPSHQQTFPTQTIMKISPISTIIIIIGVNFRESGLFNIEEDNWA